MLPCGTCLLSMNLSYSGISGKFQSLDEFIINEKYSCHLLDLNCLNGAKQPVNHGCYKFAYIYLIWLYIFNLPIYILLHYALYVFICNA